jgi:hypothetical protein
MAWASFDYVALYPTLDPSRLGIPPILSVLDDEPE